MEELCVNTEVVSETPEYANLKNSTKKEKSKNKIKKGMNKFKTMKQNRRKQGNRCVCQQFVNKKSKKKIKRD